MATLYLIEQGAQVEKEYRRLLVCKDGEVVREVPISRIERVVVMGQVGFTTPALLSLLDADIPVVFLTQQGQVRGRLMGRTGANLPLRHLQYERSHDPAFCLGIARAIVAGKLLNYRARCQRWGRRGQEVTAQVAQLRQYAQRAQQANDMGELRGLEGIGSRLYFRLLQAALPEEFSFAKRVRRPPSDPVNSLLSLAYTLLAESIFAALEVVGLDPYDGFFHSDVYNRPALALDLEEEFRGIVADSVVLTLLKRREVRLSDFTWVGRAVYLKPEALKRFLAAYTRRLNERVWHPTWKKHLTYQQVFEAQARLLAQVVRGEREAYVAFRAK